MTMTDTTLGAVATDERSYVDWPAIFAGTALATAISFVLLTFGSALGLSLTSAYEGRGLSLAGFAIAAALWLLWVQISSFMAGGYLTGRLRRRKHDATEEESDIRDGSHGLVVWAVGILLGAAIAFSGVSSAISTATSAVSTVAGGAAAGAAGSAGGIANSANLWIDRALRGTTPNQPPASAEDTRSQISRVLLSSVASDTLDPADKQYLVSTVAARAGVDEAEAGKRVDALWAQVQEAEAKARDAAEYARKISMIAAFMTAASFLVSAVGAYFGATMGGNHRDKQTAPVNWVRAW
ncbi:hypothetical protein BH10PSE7_BH10PSE7_06940 [soil metagenome]